MAEELNLAKLGVDGAGGLQEKLAAKAKAKEEAAFSPAKLTGAQKAAYLLLSIGEEHASEVIRLLNTSEIKAVGAAFNSVKDLKADEAKKVFIEYYIAAHRASRFGDSYLRTVVTKALGETKAKALVAAISRAGDGSGSLSEADPRVLANIIRKEHPQTIALLLTYTIPDKSAQVMPLLPLDVQCDVSVRMANLEGVPPEVVAEVEENLQKELQLAGAMASSEVGGIEMVAEMFNQMEKTYEVELMEKLEEQNPDLAEEIRKRMFVFDDLNALDDRGIRTLLREIDKDTLLTALKTAQQDFVDKIFKNMSKRASEMMKDDLSSMGPVKLSDVERAQQQVVQAAIALEEEGKLVFRGSGGDILV